MRSFRLTNGFTLQRGQAAFDGRPTFDVAILFPNSLRIGLGNLAGRRSPSSRLSRALSALAIKPNRSRQTAAGPDQDTRSIIICDIARTLGEREREPEHDLAVVSKRSHQGGAA